MGGIAVSSGLEVGSRRRVGGGVFRCSERGGGMSYPGISVFAFEYMLQRHVGMYRKESRTDMMSFCSSGSVEGS